MDRDERPAGSRSAGLADGAEARPPPSFSLSLGQVLASSLAAASAATVASVFGVAGTVIGTALGSVVATVATAVYQHAGQRTADRLAGLAGPLFARPQRDRRWDLKALPWRRILPGAALVFVIALAGIVTVTIFGVGHGVAQPLPSVTQPRHNQKSSTHPPALPTPTYSTSPSSTVSPTPSVIPPATGTTSPLGTAGPTPTGTGTLPQHTLLPTGTAPKATPPVTPRLLTTQPAR